MNANETPLPRPGRRLMWLFGVVLLVVTGAGALAAWEITGFVRLGGDARALRNSLKTEATQFEKRFELSAGPLTVDLARLALRAAPLPPEARSGVAALGGVEVGLYEMRREPGGFSKADWLAGADRAMAARGWERLVGVINRETLVAVYVLQDARSTGKVRVCFAILNREQLVIGSARGDLQQIAPLALGKIEQHHGRL